MRQWTSEVLSVLQTELDVEMEAEGFYRTQEVHMRVSVSLFACCCRSRRPALAPFGQLGDG